MPRSATICLLCCVLFMSGVDHTSAQQPRDSIVIGKALKNDGGKPQPGKLNSPFGIDFDAAGSIFGARYTAHYFGACNPVIVELVIIAEVTTANWAVDGIDN